MVGKVLRAFWGLQACAGHVLWESKRYVGMVGRYTNSWKLPTDT